MGATKQLKMIMLDKDIKTREFAEMYQSLPRQVNRENKGDTKTAKSPNTVYNMLRRDNMTFATVEMMADILGCDIVFKDRETGKEY